MPRHRQPLRSGQRIKRRRTQTIDSLNIAIRPSYPGSPRLRTTQNQSLPPLKKRVRDEDDDEDPYAAHSSIGRWWLFGKRDDRGLGTLVCCVIGAS